VIVGEPVGEAALVDCLGIAAGEGIGEDNLSLAQAGQRLAAAAGARWCTGRGRCGGGIEGEEASEFGEQGGREGAPEPAQDLATGYALRQVPGEAIEIKRDRSRHFHFLAPFALTPLPRFCKLAPAQCGRDSLLS
jgi:hypothetical protein